MSSKIFNIEEEIKYQHFLKYKVWPTKIQIYDGLWNFIRNQGGGKEIEKEILYDIINSKSFTECYNIVLRKIENKL